MWCLQCPPPPPPPPRGGLLGAHPPPCRTKANCLAHLKSRHMSRPRKGRLQPPYAASSQALPSSLSVPPWTLCTTQADVRRTIFTSALSSQHWVTSGQQLSITPASSRIMPKLVAEQRRCIARVSSSCSRCCMTWEPAKSATSSGLPPSLALISMFCTRHGACFDRKVSAAEACVQSEAVPRCTRCCKFGVGTRYHAPCSSNRQTA